MTIARLAHVLEFFEVIEEKVVHVSCFFSDLSQFFNSHLMLRSYIFIQQNP